MDLIDSEQISQILKLAREYEKEDPYQFLLSKSIKDDLLKKLVAEQIISLNKAKSKLPELYENRNIIFPPPLSMEQCSSEATAKFKASLLSGKKLVDLTGGFGIDCYYISQQFENVHYVERQERLCLLAEYNFEVLGLSDRIQVNNVEAEVYLSQLEKTDCIYLDPARRDENNEKVTRWQDCQPDMTSIIDDMLAKSDEVLVKAAPMLDITQAVRDLNYQVKKVFIVESNNEVKELLFLLSKKALSNTEIKAVILDRHGKDQNSFVSHVGLENQHKLQFSFPKKYLYEPSPSIMKSGFFNSLAHEFELEGLHQNTKIFTSDSLNKRFPGKVYEVKAVLPPQKKALHKLLENKQANLKCRNFPVNIQDLKKKLAIKDGGSSFLFAVTQMDNSRQLILCNKVEDQ